MCPRTESPGVLLLVALAPALGCASTGGGRSTPARALQVETALPAIEQPNVGYDGGFSRALTGEDKSFRGVSPRAPYGARAGSGNGAWVLATRLSQLDIDDAVGSKGLALPGNFTDRMHTATLGLNWIPNDHTILRNTLVYSWYDDDVLIDGQSDDQDVGLLIELQLHF